MPSVLPRSAGDGTQKVPSTTHSRSAMDARVRWGNVPNECFDNAATSRRRTGSYYGTTLSGTSSKIAGYCCIRPSSSFSDSKIYFLRTTNVLASIHATVLVLPSGSGDGHNATGSIAGHHGIVAGKSARGSSSPRIRDRHSTYSLRRMWLTIGANRFSGGIRILILGVTTPLPGVQCCTRGIVHLAKSVTGAVACDFIVATATANLHGLLREVSPSSAQRT